MLLPIQNPLEMAAGSRRSCCSPTKGSPCLPPPEGSCRIHAEAAEADGEGLWVKVELKHDQLLRQGLGGGVPTAGGELPSVEEPSHSALGSIQVRAINHCRNIQSYHFFF